MYVTRFGHCSGIFSFSPDHIGLMYVLLFDMISRGICLCPILIMKNRTKSKNDTMWAFVITLNRTKEYNTRRRGHTVISDIRSSNTYLSLIYSCFMWGKNIEGVQFLIRRQAYIMFLSMCVGSCQECGCVKKQWQSPMEKLHNYCFTLDLKYTLMYPYHLRLRLFFVSILIKPNKIDYLCTSHFTELHLPHIPHTWNLRWLPKKC